MLTGYGSLSVSLVFLWVRFFDSGMLYQGSWIGITLWAVYENAWELHRRTGMFAYLGGTVTALATLGMLLMIFLG